MGKQVMVYQSDRKGTTTRNDAHASGRCYGSSSKIIAGQRRTRQLLLVKEKKLCRPRRLNVVRKLKFGAWNK